MSKAYLTQGEPLYNELKFMFGTEGPIANEDNPIIIPNSDDEDEQVPNALDALPPPEPTDEQVPNAHNEDDLVAPVIVISDNEDDDILDDEDNDSEDYFPLSSLEEAAGEVVNNDDGGDEVISPMARTFTDVIPRFKYEPSDGVCIHGGRNTTLSKKEVRSNSSSAENSPLKSTRLFGEGLGSKK
ncbi:hypothetical protein ACS0TY_013321 [Phlomoides rotata]